MQSLVFRLHQMGLPGKPSFRSTADLNRRQDSNPITFVEAGFRMRIVANSFTYIKLVLPPTSRAPSPLGISPFLPTTNSR